MIEHSLILLKFLPLYIIGSSKGPPPKPAKRKPRANLEAAPSEAPPDKPPPRPEAKGRARPPPRAPAAAPATIEPAQPVKKVGAAAGDDSKIEALDLGRDHEGVPHGWSPSYWKYVTVSFNKIACTHGVMVANLPAKKAAGLI